MTEREEFEEWYAVNAFNYERDPIGSRDCGLQWAVYQAGRASGERDAVRACAEIARAMASHEVPEAFRIGAARVIAGIRIAYPQHFPGDAG